MMLGMNKKIFSSSYMTLSTFSMTPFTAPFSVWPFATCFLPIMYSGVVPGFSMSSLKRESDGISCLWDWVCLFATAQQTAKGRSCVFGLWVNRNYRTITQADKEEQGCSMPIAPDYSEAQRDWRDWREERIREQGLTRLWDSTHTTKDGAAYSVIDMVYAWMLLLSSSLQNHFSEIRTKSVHVEFRWFVGKERTLNPQYLSILGILSRWCTIHIMVMYLSRVLVWAESHC